MTMDLREQFVDSSKLIGDMVAKNVLKDPQLYKQIVEMVLFEPMPMSSRAGRVLNICTDESPALFVPYIDTVIKQIKNEKEIHRCILKVFAEVSLELNEQQEGILIDYCFNLLSDESQSVANKIYSMGILEKFAEKEPGIIPELLCVLEEVILLGTAGVKSRGVKLIKKLRKSGHNS